MHIMIILFILLMPSTYRIIKTTCSFYFYFLGVLILSLDKDTYELLGLTGKASAFQKKHRFSEYGFK